MERSTVESVKVLAIVVVLVVVSTLLATLMSTTSSKDGMTLIEEAFGFKWSFSPASAVVVVVALVTGELFLVLNVGRASRRVETVVVVAFAVLSGAMALAFGRRLFVTYFSEASSALSMILAISVFSGNFVMFLILIEECSEGMKNAVLVVFSATTGAFFGVSFPTVTVLVMLTVLVSVDLILTRGRMNGRGSDGYLEPFKTAFTTAWWSIGVGDLLCYAILASHVAVVGGSILFVPTSSLLLMGTVGTMRWAESARTKYVPGLVGTVGLGSFPLAVWWLATLA